MMFLRFSIPILFLSLSRAQSSGLQDITPVPKEHFDPRVSEFLRIDGNADQQITFAEFILGDTEYIREQSKNFHRFDTNGDNVITKAEYDAYFKNHEGRNGRRGEHDDFMRRMGCMLGFRETDSHLPLGISLRITATGEARIRFTETPYDSYDGVRRRREIHVDGYYSSHHAISHSGTIPVVTDHVIVYNYDPTLGITRIFPLSRQTGGVSNGVNGNIMLNSDQSSNQNGMSSGGVSNTAGARSDSSGDSTGGSSSLSDITSLIQKIPGASSIPGLSSLQSIASLTNSATHNYSLLLVALYFILINIK